MGKSRHTAPPPGRQISRREADLLRHVMTDVAPLPGREVVLPAAEAPVEPPAPEPLAAAPTEAPASNGEDSGDAVGEPVPDDAPEGPRRRGWWQRFS